MKTKLHFSTIQNFKNGVLSFLIIFLLTVTSFGQTTFNLEATCVDAGITPLFFQFENPDQSNVVIGQVLDSNKDLVQSGWHLLVVPSNPQSPTNNYDRWEIQDPGGVRWFYTADIPLPDPCNAIWIIDETIGGVGAPCENVIGVTCTGGPPEEICDGIDNDGDGGIDEGLPVTTFYIDGDEDGYGSILDLVGEEFCSDPGVGYSLTNDDCDDTDVAVNLDAMEVCDGVDNNCDGNVDEGLTFTTYYVDTDGDGFGDELNTGTGFCADPGVGYSLTNDDCDDLEFDVYPGALEICDGLDNNCDGQIDEGITGCIDGVIIEYCDDKQKKVLICHNGKTKCVSINAMDAHLAHGDYLGTCGGNSKEAQDIAEEVPTFYDVVSWPNPTRDSFNIRMSTPNTTDKVSIEAFDINGRLIHSNLINGNEDYQFGSQLTTGVYFVRLSQADKTKVVKIIKQ